MSKRINWDKIKQEYFDSDEDEIRYFIKYHASTTPVPTSENTIKKYTNGWRDEKKEFKKNLFAKIQAETEKKLIKQGANSRVAIINKALENTEMKIAELLGKPDNRFSFEDLNKIKTGWEILRTVTGQSTNNTTVEVNNTINLSNLTDEELKMYLELEKKLNNE